MPPLLPLLLSACVATVAMPLDSTPQFQKRCGDTLKATLQPATLESNAANCEWQLETDVASSLIKLEFASLDLPCGQECITVSGDGSVLAKVCSSQLPPAIYATSSMTVATTTSHGFQATYQAIDACSACGHGTCHNGTCACEPGFHGAACDQLDFSRSSHGAVYYPARDSMIVYGGTTLNGLASPNLVEFHFGNMSWTIPTVSSRSSPMARYGHTLFLHDNNVYCFGGNGVPGVVFSDLWRLDPETWSWDQLAFSGNAKPPALIDPTVTLVPQANNSARMFVFGGYTASDHTISRNLYAYDIGTATWHNDLHANSIGCVGAQGIYHPETESIYYLSGVREDGASNNAIFEYHIASDLWYLGQAQLGYDGRKGGASVLLKENENDSNYALLLGGQGPPSDNNCFHSDAQIYDFACGTYTTSATQLQTNASNARMGFSLILRNQDAWVFGGQNGIDLGDVRQVQTPTVPRTTESQEQLCKSLRWCSTYNDCDDCQQRPHCSYTRGNCMFNQTSPSSNATCPARISLNVGESYQGELSDRLVFKTFVDAPNGDLLFRFSSTANDLVAITFETLNGWQGERNDNNKGVVFNSQGEPYRLMNSTDQVPITFSLTQATPTPFIGVSPLVSLKANDTRRYSGYYVYQLRNTDGAAHTVRISVDVKNSTTSGINADGSPGQQQQQNDDEQNPSETLKIIALTLFCFACVLFIIAGVFGSRRLRRYMRDSGAEDDHADRPGIEGPDELGMELSETNVPDIYYIKAPKQWRCEHSQPNSGPPREPAAIQDSNTLFPIMPLSAQPRSLSDGHPTTCAGGSSSSEAETSNSHNDNISQYVLHYAVLLPTPPIPPSSSSRNGQQQPTALPNVTLATTLVQVDLAR